MQLQEVMRQAARMQRKVEAAREEIKDNEISASAAGDKVTATVTCEGKVKSLVVDPEFLKEEGQEMAFAALSAAINSALETAKKTMDDHVKKVTGGVKIPGL
jgi:nucleoid-associated protein EbfC